MRLLSQRGSWRCSSYFLRTPKYSRRGGFDCFWESTLLRYFCCYRTDPFDGRCDISSQNLIIHFAILRHFAWCYCCCSLESDTNDCHRGRAISIGCSFRRSMLDASGFLHRPPFRYVRKSLAFLCGCSPTCG